MSAAKFAKKGSLVVDVKNAKLAKVGDTDAKSKKILKDANIQEAKPDAKGLAKAMKASKEKPVAGKKEVKAAKGKAPKQERASASKLDDKKIKALVKEKDLEAREGSKRREWMVALITSKTIGEAREKVDGLDAGVVNFAVTQGIIELQ